VRLYRRSDPARDRKLARGQSDDRGLSYHWDDDGSLVVKGRLPPEQGALLIEALRAAGSALRADEAPAAECSGHATALPRNRVQCLKSAACASATPTRWA